MPDYISNRMQENPTLLALGTLSYPARITAISLVVFAFSSSFSIAAAQICLGLAVLAALAGLNARREWSCLASARPVLAGIGLYVLWLVVSSLLGFDPPASLWAIREEWLFLIVPLTLLTVRRWGRSGPLILALAVGLVLVGAYGIIQHFTGWYFFSDTGLHSVRGNFRLSGNFSHPLTYGYFVVVATLFLSSYLWSNYRSQRGWKLILLVAAVAAGLAASALCNSRGPLLALGVGLIVLGLLHRRVVATVSILVALVVGAIALSPGLVSEFGNRLKNDLKTENPAGRLYIWSTTWRIIEDHPLTGTGPGHFAPAYTEQLPADSPRSDHKGHAHNDYLHIAATTGIPGLILYLAVWGFVIVRLFRLMNDTSAPSEGRFLARASLIATVAFMAASMTEAAFSDEELRQLLMMLWGIGLAGTVTPQQHDPARPD